MDTFSLILDPLRSYALPVLSARSLAHLREVYQAAQVLVDERTGSTWRAAATALVDHTCLPCDEHGYAVQRELKDQGALLQSLLAGPSAGYVRVYNELANFPSRFYHESLEWQPFSAASAASCWVIIGHLALNSETLATTVLGQEKKVSWISWCGDGLHVVLAERCINSQHLQISVRHVASGDLIGSLGCVMPDKFRFPEYPEYTVVSALVASGAQAVLAPESLQAVSLCKLPSLKKVAQLVSPGVIGEAGEVFSMGWAAHGSLIAIAWSTADLQAAVTVSSGSDGSLCHTFCLAQHTSQGRPNCNARLEAFSVCLDQPAAAAVWRSGDHMEVALVNLSTSTLTTLEHTRPSWDPCGWRDDIDDEPPHSWWTLREGKCEYDLSWAPQGRHVVVHETLDPETLRRTLDLGVFTVPSGEWCGQNFTWGDYAGYLSQDLYWSSNGTLCLSQLQNALDLSAKPAIALQYFSPRADDHSSNYVDGVPYDPCNCEFVSGTWDLIDLRMPISHWVYNASIQSSLCHQVSGLTKEKPKENSLKGYKGNKGLPGTIAWHPTLKAAAVYAYVEAGPASAVYLIDAKRHRCLATWSTHELAGVFQKAPGLGGAGARTGIAWSPDGKKLVLTAYCRASGAIILNYANMQAEQTVSAKGSHLLNGASASMPV